MDGGGHGLQPRRQPRLVDHPRHEFGVHVSCTKFQHRRAGPHLRAAPSAQRRLQRGGHSGAPAGVATARGVQRGMPLRCQTGTPLPAASTRRPWKRNSSSILHASGRHACVVAAPGSGASGAGSACTQCPSLVPPDPPANKVGRLLPHKGVAGVEVRQPGHAALPALRAGGGRSRWEGLQPWPPGPRASQHPTGHPAGRHKLAAAPAACLLMRVVLSWKAGKEQSGLHSPAATSLVQLWKYSSLSKGFSGGPSGAVLYLRQGRGRGAAGVA